MKNTVQGSLITTFRCNAKCNMCNIWKHQTRPLDELDPAFYDKLPPGLRINITGGEPTLRADIDEIFAKLYPKAALLELSTNGYYTEKIVALANKYPNILIRVSLEGLPALNHAKRGTPDGFDHALRTMLELKKTPCKNIGFSVVISPDNYKDLVHLYDLCVALDVELGEVRDVFESDLASLRDDLVADSLVFERLLKRVHVVAGRGTGVPDSGHRGEHLWAALNRGALHVVEHAAHAAQLFAAARAPGPAVHEHRQR